MLVALALATGCVAERDDGESFGYTSLTAADGSDDGIDESDTGGMDDDDGGTSDGSGGVDETGNDSADTGADTGDGIPDNASFVQMGSPPGGYPIITDLAVFADRLYVTTSLNPLGSFGASVFYTTDGQSFQSVLSDSSSQGFLRLRVFDGTLYIPDGDPNGYDPSYVYVSTDGQQLQKTTIANAVHTFDVVSFEGDVLASNGMLSGKGSLCRSDGGGQWPEVVATPYGRLRYMTTFQGKLLVGKSAVGSSADYLLFSGSVDSSQGDAFDAVPGEAITFRWYPSSNGRLYWSLAANSQLEVRTSSDGQSWTQVPELTGEFVSDFADFGGRVYALTNSGLWESIDGGTFTRAIDAPSGAFDPLDTGQGFSVDAMASLASFDGALWSGSSQNGTLYRIE